MSTMIKTNPRVTVENGWAVRNHDDGSQTRARLIPDPHHPEPERGAGMWNEGVLLVRERDSYRGIVLDEHDGLSAVLERTWDAPRAHGVSVHHENETADGGWPADSRLGITREEFVRRYLRAFYGVQHASLRHHSDMGDWADIWVIVEGVEDGADVDALADATWEEWDAWASGEVYVVESQTRTLTDAMFADGDDPDDGWEDDTRVGGYYGDDGATAGLAELLGVDPDDVPNVWSVMADTIY